MNQPLIVVMDDEIRWCEFLKMFLEENNYKVETFTDPHEGMEFIIEHFSEVKTVFTDLKMPGLTGMEVLKKLRSLGWKIPVIMITGHGTVQDAIEAMKNGAFEYVTKPFGIDEVLTILQKSMEHYELLTENQDLKEKLDFQEAGYHIVGNSSKMQSLFKLIGKISNSSVSVMVLGESGTGKELIAREIHKNSPRADKPFVALNCSSLTPTLLESELFGYMKGSFTGANTNKKGLLEESDGGTLFLDEIGDISPKIQLELLRFLQEGEVRPIGSNQIVQVNTRLICATNRDIELLVKNGLMREDFYYRINVVTLKVPPLREREEDIDSIARYFVRKYAYREDKNLKGISQEALSVLTCSDWPGNVRELENVIERAVILTNGNVVTINELPASLLLERPEKSGLNFMDEKELVIRNFEIRKIEEYLRISGFKVSKAAKLAGMPRQSFYRLMGKYNIQIPKQEN